MPTFVTPAKRLQSDSPIKLAPRTDWPGRISNGNLEVLVVGLNVLAVQQRADHACKHIGQILLHRLLINV